MWRRLAATALLVSEVIAVGACAPPATTPSGSWGPADIPSAIVTRSASAAVASGASSYRLTVTASCHAGEQLVGGGFAGGNVFEYALIPHASYPVANGWRVTTDSISAYSLTTFAYCLPGNPSLGTQIVHGEVCPRDATRLSHGFTEDGPALLCAMRHVLFIARAATPIALHATTNGYMAQSAAATCPDGSVALDGGATLGLALYSAASAGFASWEVSAGGDGTGEIYAECVAFT